MRTMELLADGELDRAVRVAWQRLDRAGFSSVGQHRHPTNRPHLTLASTDHFPPGAVAAIAGALRVLPILVRLDGADRNPQHAPGAWVPHISLARRLRPGQAALAAQAAGGAVAGGSLSTARSYDTATRTVVSLL